MDLKEYLKENLLYLDGGMGTLLQERGLPVGTLPESWNITHPETVKNIHLEYYNSGSNVVHTNTFGANILKFSEKELEKVISSALRCAKEAMNECACEQPRWVALDIGPTGKMLKPYGDLDFEEAVEIFAKTVRLGVKYGCDLISIETMNDSYETKAALLAAKENSTLPVFVSNAYGSDGALMTGAKPAAMVAMLEGLGADAIGVNCSLGPKGLENVIAEYVNLSSLPVILKPNAGLPKILDGRTIFDVSSEEFALDVSKMAEAGVRILGGCCGTTPEYIKELRAKTKGIEIKKSECKDITMVSSYTHAVIFGEKPILIGERINPTGKKRFKEALKNRDIDYILKEGISQEENGADILDVNVGLPEIDEAEMLSLVTLELQSVTDLPLQIDTADPVALEGALRKYNGKPMINSVNGKKESMNSVFPLAKKYGGVIVALTLDENGIPETAEGRFDIARKILAGAEKWGISKKDIVFDPLALTISADPNSAQQTLRAIRMIREKLGCHTSLGISNVSFGLPSRDYINSTFFSLALGAGLSAAIANPHSLELMKTYYSYCALCGLDKNCQNFIEFAQTNIIGTSTTGTSTTGTSEALLPQAQAPQAQAQIDSSELQSAIIKGLKERTATLTKELLKTEEPLCIIQNEIIPALNIVGRGFEEKTVYLPALLICAETAKVAFEVIKSSMSTDRVANKCAVVLATVRGDIHDIGKNIVKLLLENYGFAVTDLGRDVSPEVISEKVVELNAPIAALSALMTTTLPSMEETITLLRKNAPTCRIIVGGAVLTEDYAKKINSDHYAKDAMEAVRCAELINKELVADVY